MTKVLVDTSIWLQHFREGNVDLMHLLECDAVLIHPTVIAEIGCSTLPERAHTLSDLATLQVAQQASPAEVMDLIERKNLYGQGYGIIDLTLLASVLITPGSELWTMDQQLSSISEQFGVRYYPKLH